MIYIGGHKDYSTSTYWNSSWLIFSCLLPLQYCDMWEHGGNTGRMSWTLRHRDADSFALHLWFNAELVWGNANPGNVCCGDRMMGMKMRSPLVCILRWTNRRLNQPITASTLTGQTVDHRRLLLLLFFVWCCTVFSVHLADRGGALSLDLGVKFLVKENLVDQVWLDRTGLCRGLGGPIVISWMMRYKSPSEYV